MLRPCGRHFRAAGVPECSELRATVLRLDLPKALGVRGRTAAWVWWGGDPPAWPPELFVRVNGFNALPLRWRGLGIGVLPREQPGDVVVCAGLRLTSPERTVRDIAIRADAR
ncbi:MAG: hypothetical protein LKF88_05435 [Microbacteriaceae bacterium]|nr:hypothetical protein [Microbacteriaceae bacterium]MCI1207588.1 hypothetical protein [Microbacteriaceae bacterium]